MSKLPYDFIYNLIGKKLSEQISNADNDILNDWINSSNEAKICFEDLKMHWDNIQFFSDINKSLSQVDIGDAIWNKTFK